MSSDSPYRDLQINEDIRFERRIWRVQRVGLVCIGGIVLAGLAGLFGRGLLSSAEAGGNAAGLRVEYNRFMRNTAPDRIELVVLDRDRSTGELHIWFDPGPGGNVQFEEIHPQPDRTLVSTEGSANYVFLLDPTTDRPRITVRIRPECVGRLPLRVGLDGQTPVEFTVFVYP